MNCAVWCFLLSFDYVPPSIIDLTKMARTRNYVIWRQTLYPIDLLLRRCVSTLWLREMQTTTKTTGRAEKSLKKTVKICMDLQDTRWKAETQPASGMFQGNIKIVHWLKKKTKQNFFSGGFVLYIRWTSLAVFFFFLKIKKHVFIWLCQVLVESHGIFSCDMRALSFMYGV